MTIFGLMLMDSSVGNHKQPAARAPDEVCIFILIS